MPQKTLIPRARFNMRVTERARQQEGGQTKQAQRTDRRKPARQEARPAKLASQRKSQQKLASSVNRVISAPKSYKAHDEKHTPANSSHSHSHTHLRTLNSFPHTPFAPRYPLPFPLSTPLSHPRTHVHSARTHSRTHLAPSALSASLPSLPLLDSRSVASSVMLSARLVSCTAGGIVYRAKFVYYSAPLAPGG